MKIGAGWYCNKVRVLRNALQVYGPMMDDAVEVLNFIDKNYRDFHRITIKDIEEVNKIKREAETKLIKKTMNFYQGCYYLMLDICGNIGHEKDFPLSRVFKCAYPDDEGYRSEVAISRTKDYFLLEASLLRYGEEWYRWHCSMCWADLISKYGLKKAIRAIVKARIERLQYD